VIERDPISLEGLVSNLSHRFARDVVVTGDRSAETALPVLRAEAAVKEGLDTVLLERDASG
jgi:hypothetical protein